jgi:hypothetical protein
MACRLVTPRQGAWTESPFLYPIAAAGQGGMGLETCSLSGILLRRSGAHCGSKASTWIDPQPPAIFSRFRPLANGVRIAPSDLPSTICVPRPMGKAAAMAAKGVGPEQPASLSLGMKTQLPRSIREGVDHDVSPSE